MNVSMVKQWELLQQVTNISAWSSVHVLACKVAATPSAAAAFADKHTR